MFVEVMPYSNPNNLLLTFRLPIDCASPNRPSALCTVDIKPPVIAAPLQLSSGSAECGDYKEASGRSDCKTFVLNTPIVNKQGCSNILINGSAGCSVNEGSDVICVM